MNSLKGSDCHNKHIPQINNVIAAKFRFC